MMMLDKTVEQLKKELHNARAAVSYHKNKNKPDRHKKGESPQAKANRLAANKAWNDNKRAMAHVIALLTAENDAGYKDAYTQACAMPVDDSRELTKGHEAAVEKQVKVLQEQRKAREENSKVQKMLDEWADESKPKPEPKPKLTPKPEPIQTIPVYVPLEDAKKVSISIKRELLDRAQNVVAVATGVEGLSKEQVVGYILNRYLKYNK